MNKFFLASSFAAATSFYFFLKYSKRNKMSAKLPKDSGEHTTVDIPSTEKKSCAKDKEINKNNCWCSQQTVLTCGQCRKKFCIKFV